MGEQEKKKIEDVRSNIKGIGEFTEEFLNKSIKDVVKQYPKIENILDEYNIGCVSCNVGTCLLKDIVKIHNLSVDEEQKLMAKITKVIYPKREIKISQIKRKTQSTHEIKYSPPVKKLVEEHVLIKRWVALIPDIIRTFDFNSEENKQIILDGVDFIRFYADQYHHAKEEKILFNYFDENLTIFKIMHEDHKKARMQVRAILDAMKLEDKDAVLEHLSSYREILLEHIKKEDEVLYPWADRNLSITQIGNLFSKFNEIDQQFENTSTKYTEFIKKLEKKFTAKEEVTK